MRRLLALTLTLALVGGLVSASGQAKGEPAATAGSGGSEPLKTHGTRDIRNFSVQKQRQTYSRQTSTPPPVDKRSRAAVFAKGVSDFYPAARANQSRNSNVIDPKSLCVPGRRALLQR